MLPRHGHTSDTARLRVTVTDAVGLQRVLTLLNGRRHGFTRFEAEESGSGTWAVRLDLPIGPDELEFVLLRLHRLPSVLAVELHPASVLSATG